MGFYLGRAHGWLTGHRRRLTERIAVGLLDRIADAPRLDAAQRSWLLRDLQEDLACQVEDAERRGVTERGARELLDTGGIVRWLAVGDAPPVMAIELLERAVAMSSRQPGDEERRRREAYLGAIGELGGDEATASGPWRDDLDARERALLEFQGRRLRGRMEELGMTIGELGERSGIDTVTLVAILFGEEEMRATHWILLSKALDVPLEWMLEGIRFVPPADPAGRGFYEIEPEPDGSAEGKTDEEGPAAGHETGDAR